MKFRILVILFLHTILIFGFEYKVTVLSNEFDGDYDIFVSRIMPDGSNLIISSKLGGKTEDGSITITKDISSVRSRYSIALSSDITDECNIWIKDMFANDNSPYSKSISPCSVKVERAQKKF